ncbi:pyruvate kinase, partial [Patescibacteria group bacterium]|nr:pyruvate kinase [Patescibacteria group bacterium]
MEFHNTKFVCTLGPASHDIGVLEKMMKAGMDVARLNFSHGNYKDHEELMKNIRSVAKKVGVPLAIMQDLQGPKIRIGKVQEEGIKIIRNKIIILNCGKASKDKIPVQYKNLYKDVKKGSLLLVDDGLIELKVVKIYEKEIHCKVLNSGIIKSNKGINAPGATISINPITKKDKEDLAFGLKNDVDYVAMSFVKEAKNIHDLRKLIKAAKKNTQIIAKIERAEAVENLEEIIQAADGLMVARGDLAMEIGPERVPIIQKSMIKMCNLAGKPVITATQMLQSMVTNPQPTRAEVSDVANAIFDRSDAVMLSNESAVGDYPVRAVKVFAKIAHNVEEELKKHTELIPIKCVKTDTDPMDAIGYEVCKLAENTGVKKIIVITNSGHAAKFVSKHRSYIHTIVITPSEKV